MCNILWKCVIFVIVLPIFLTLGKYDCQRLERNVFCTDLKEKHIYENLTITMSKEQSNDIIELQIANSTIFTVRRDMFVNFQNIRILRLTNTSTHTIEDGAFQDLIYLEKIFLTDNYLGEIKSAAFPLNNSINTIEVSHNILNNLDNFEVESFPLLKIMNISYNKLEYLPQNLINKVKERNTFYLIVYNNPWNCMHTKWKDYLTEKLVMAFCNDKTYDSNEADKKVKALAHLENGNATKSEQETDALFCLKYSFKTCLLWALGGIWIGVIIGNSCRLKRMLFTSPIRYEDKNTQCEFSWREQPFLIKEEYSKADTQNTKMLSKLNIPKVLKD